MNRAEHTFDSLDASASHTISLSAKASDSNTTSVWWSQQWLIYVAVGLGFFVGVIAASIWAAYFYRKRQQIKKDSLRPTYPTSDSNKQPSIIIPKGSLRLYPPSSLITIASNIQPAATTTYVTPGFATPVAMPSHDTAHSFRSRTRGILQRRSSNNSALTIDLTPAPGQGLAVSPTEEKSDPMQYLMNAGNRLTPNQLRLCLDNPHQLAEEFWDIPLNQHEQVLVIGSGIKNRYRYIIPNEESRVVLPVDEMSGDPLSHYINANYIRGYDGESKAYIATQGPMSHTCSDFWRMVLNEACPAIVMITSLREKNKNKCDVYLPLNETGSIIYGVIKVTVLSCSEYTGYTVRRLLLRIQDSGLSNMPDKREHQCLHFWFSAWPDHKTPETARQLLELCKAVEAIRYTDDVGQANTQGPVIVHCSAGIGRTGCFIGSSIGIQQLRAEGAVDILGIVCNMRLDRGGMVQTNEQYEFIYQTLELYSEDLADELRRNNNVDSKSSPPIRSSVSQSQSNSVSLSDDEQ